MLTVSADYNSMHNRINKQKRLSLAFNGLATDVLTAARKEIPCYWGGNAHIFKSPQRRSCFVEPYLGNEKLDQVIGLFFERWKPDRGLSTKLAFKRARTYWNNDKNHKDLQKTFGYDIKKFLRYMRGVKREIQYAKVFDPEYYGELETEGNIIVGKKGKRKVKYKGDGINSHDPEFLYTVTKETIMEVDKAGGLEFRVPCYAESFVPRNSVGDNVGSTDIGAEGLGGIMNPAYPENFGIYVRRFKKIIDIFFDEEIRMNLVIDYHLPGSVDMPYYKENMVKFFGALASHVQAKKAEYAVKKAAVEAMSAAARAIEELKGKKSFKRAEYTDETIFEEAVAAVKKVLGERQTYSDLDVLEQALIETKKVITPDKIHNPTRVIYNPGNEPGQVPGEMVIDFVEAAIAEIDKYDPHTIFYIPSPFWCQRPDEVAALCKKYPGRIVIDEHNYPGTHGPVSKATQLEQIKDLHVLPSDQTNRTLKISEDCPTTACEVSDDDAWGGGDAPNYHRYPQAFRKVMRHFRNEGIGAKFWCLSNGAHKKETCAMLKQGVPMTGPWTVAGLKEAETTLTAKDIENHIRKLEILKSGAPINLTWTKNGLKKTSLIKPKDITKYAQSLKPGEPIKGLFITDGFQRIKITERELEEYNRTGTIKLRTGKRFHLAPKSIPREKALPEQIAEAKPLHGLDLSVSSLSQSGRDALVQLNCSAADRVRTHLNEQKPLEDGYILDKLRTKRQLNAQRRKEAKIQVENAVAQAEEVGAAS